MIVFSIVIIFSLFQFPISCKPGGVNLFVGVVALDGDVEMMTSDVIEVSSGGYITCGVSSGVDFERKIILVNRVKGNGEVLWSKSFDGGGESDHGCAFIKETTDLGFIVVGTMSSVGDTELGALFLKLSSTGTVVWKSLYSPPGSKLYVRGVEEVNDGIVVVGQFQHPTYEYGQGLIVKIDDLGTLLWSRVLGTNSTELRSIQSYDGGFIVGGFQKIGASSMRIFLAKVSTEGNIEWSQSLQEFHDDDFVSYRTAALSFGDDDAIYVLGQRSKYFVTEYSGFISKFNKTGDLLWIRSYEGCSFQTGVPNYDGNVFALGGSLFYSNGSWFAHSCAFKIDSDDGTVLEAKTSGMGELGFQYFSYSKPVYPYSDERFDGRYFIVINGISELLYQIMTVNNTHSSDPDDGFMFFKIGMQQYPLENITERTNLTWLTQYSTEDITARLGDEDIIPSYPDLSIETGKLLTVGRIYYAVCNENYYSSRFYADCDVTTCDGVFSNETSVVCEGRGVCVGYDECVTVELFGISNGIRDYDVRLYSSSSTQSGGLISCGSADGPDSQGMYLHKTDGMGNTRFVGILKYGSDMDTCMAVAELGDTGVVLAGNASGNLMVAKLSSSGTDDWSWGLPDDGSPSIARDLTIGGMGEVLVVGDFVENSNGVQQGVFLKIHPDGGLLFQRRINMEEDCYFNGVVALSNNEDYVYVGCRKKATGECNPLIGKIKKGGLEEWTVQLENDLESVFYSAKETIDGNHIIAGGSAKGRTWMPLMVKVNSTSGEIVFAKVLNISSVSYAYSVEIMTDSSGEELGYIFVGFVMNQYFRLVFLEIFLSSDGESLLIRFGDPNFGQGDGHSVLHSITKDAYHEGRFIVAGSSGNMGYHSRLDVNASNCNLYNSSTCTNNCEELNVIWEFPHYPIYLDEYGFQDFPETGDESVYTPSYEPISVPSNTRQVNKSCWSCVGIRNDLPPEMLCNGRGVCSDDFECVCQVEYLGDECDVPGFCFNISRNSTSVCSGQGTCVDLDVCECEVEHFSEFGECEKTYCYSLYNNVEGYVSLDNQFVEILNSTDPNITCSGYGTCNFDFGNCSCVDESLYWGVGCHRFECFDIINNDTHRVCSGHGICVDHNVCDCEELYSGAKCEVHNCFGVLMNDSSVCTGHGECISHDNCSCEINYNSSTDDGCDQWKCDGNWRDNLILACSGHGECISHDNCSCYDGYEDSFCGVWSCWGVSSMDIDDVCAGHGVCMDLDECFCKSGYGSTFPNGNCIIWYCGQYLNSNNESVCNARGDCVESHNCECRDDYEGFECESWSCYYTPYDSALTCSGNGDCLSPNNCSCNYGFDGDNCEVNLWYYFVLIPSLSAAGLCLLLCLMTIMCCICCFILFLVFAFCLCLCGLGGVVSKQRVGMKKFSKLRDFDLLLKEQELEDDTSVAHFRVNKSLFQIPFDEIKVDRILGEGGSQSVVFLASWKTQEVAFKCFKTRHICGDQESYEEFEKEVEILSSVSHPSIVRFFGATMKPPRVGIIMEYCKHGDLDVFLSGFQEKYGVLFPLREKYRVLMEQASACAYLHSRKIIHRDLKLENVLLDSQLSSKLMDFGLSKIVDRMSKQKTKKIGTNIYMAPELVVGDGKYDEKCDMFSFAMMIFIIMTENRHPYGKRQNVEMKVANDPSFRPNMKELENVLPEEMEWLIDVVERGWDVDTEERPSFDKLAKVFKENRSDKEKMELFDQDSRKGSNRSDRVSQLLRSNRDSIQMLQDEEKMRSLSGSGGVGQEQECSKCSRVEQKFKTFCEEKGFDFDEIMSSSEVPKKKILFDRKISEENSKEHSERESSSSTSSEEEKEDKEEENSKDSDEFATSDSD